MYNLVDSLYKIAVLVSPFMPETAQKMINQLGLEKEVTKLHLDDIKEWKSYPIGNHLNEAVPLFPRIELEEEPKKEYNEDLKIENPITIDDFNKIEIKVVQIEKVEKIENADKLLKFIVNTGKENRQIISRIAKWYPNEQELVGKKVQAILNLKPVELKGELSQGMLLTATEKKKTKLIIIDDEIKIGTTVK